MYLSCNKLNGSLKPDFLPFGMEADDLADFDDFPGFPFFLAVPCLGDI
jgi:hypothetical protein